MEERRYARHDDTGRSPPLSYDPRSWTHARAADPVVPPTSGRRARLVIASMAVCTLCIGLWNAAPLFRPAIEPVAGPSPAAPPRARPAMPAPPAQTPQRGAAIRIIRGEVDRTSFYSSAVAAGLRDALIPEFARAMAHDVDFQRDLAPGDVFEAAYRSSPEAAGQTTPPELLYISLTTRNRSIALYRFTPPDAAAPGWFDGNGASVTRSLLRTPVDGARVSSSFGPRVHPILGYTRLHKGTDFAVPIGTAVYASGDGVVSFAGVARGYGNYLRIRHAAGVETAYAHLSRFGEGMSVGTTVRQGQQVALSGDSGLSSGPHLHYEVYLDGAAIDPVTVATASGCLLEGPARAGFLRARDRTDRLRHGG